MGVNHRSADIAVAEEFLIRADVIPVFKQMGCKRMSKRVRACRLGYPSLANGLFHRFLQNGFVQVMSAFFSGCPIYVMARCRKYPLPPPFLARVGIFAIEGVRQSDLAQAVFEIALVLLFDKIE